MAVARGVETRTLWQTETPAEQGYRSRNRIGPKRCAVQIRKYQIEIGCAALTRSDQPSPRNNSARLISTTGAIRRAVSTVMMIRLH